MIAHSCWNELSFQEKGVGIIEFVFVLEHKILKSCIACFSVNLHAQSIESYFACCANCREGSSDIPSDATRSLLVIGRQLSGD
jgi:hypothetical protein